jgi:ribosomal protein L37AE/L43A
MVLGLIDQIRFSASKGEYSGLPTELEQQIAQRDIALISLGWLWFKRGREDLGTRMRDIYYDTDKLIVTFRVQKKEKRYKHCPECYTSNAKSARFCKHCGINIKDVQYEVETPKPKVVSKERLRGDIFVENIIRWIETMRTLGAKPEDFVFPPYKLEVHGLSIGSRPRGEFDNRKANEMSVQRFDQILQRFDNTMTSAMFRYGHTEQLFRSGYTSHEIMKVGDWTSEYMPERYAGRLGLTEAEQKYAKDKEA